MESEISIFSIPADDLPSAIRHGLDENQRKLLSFGKETFKVIGLPLVKTIPAIPLKEGQPTRRADIQLELENETTHKTMLLDEVFPVEKVLSAEPGDVFTLFYVRGDDSNLIDKSFIDWKPIAAIDERTKELMHWEHVPVVIVPKRRASRHRLPMWLHRLIVIIAIIVLSAAGVGFLYYRFNPSDQPLFFEQAGKIPYGGGGAYYGSSFGGGGSGGGDDGDGGDGGDGGGDGGGGD